MSEPDNGYKGDETEPDLATEFVELINSRPGDRMFPEVGLVLYEQMRELNSSQPMIDFLRQVAEQIDTTQPLGTITNEALAARAFDMLAFMSWEETEIDPITQLEAWKAYFETDAFFSGLEPMTMSKVVYDELYFMKAPIIPDLIDLIEQSLKDRIERFGQEPGFSDAIVKPDLENPNQIEWFDSIHELEATNPEYLALYNSIVTITWFIADGRKNYHLNY